MASKINIDGYLGQPKGQRVQQIAKLVKEAIEQAVRKELYPNRVGLLGVKDYFGSSSSMKDDLVERLNQDPSYQVRLSADGRHQWQLRITWLTQSDDAGAV